MDRVAVVTGAGRGLGEAVARLFADNQISVSLCDIDRSRVDGVADEMRSHGANVESFGLDVAIPDECDELVGGTIRRFGGVDILVNCAAICPRITIEDMTEEHYDRIMSVNLKSVFFLSRAAGEAMKARGWGRIVNVSSIGGRTGGIFAATVYSASKAGIISMTKAFARHYAPHGILVNCIAPGSIDTQLMRDLTPQELQQTIDGVALKRLAEPRETARVVLFLASEHASYMTGTTVDVNGGALMPD